MAMTSDSGRGMTVEERDAFLTSGAIFAKIATTMADGWPVVSPVWFDWLAQDNAFLVISKARTSMVRNLHRDPRCGVLVDNPGLPYKRVSVLGEAEFLPEDFDWITPARGMAERYLGAPGVAYAETTFEFPREPFLVHARKMTTWNGGGFDRTFFWPTTWHDMSAPQSPRSPGP
ncbi:MAG: pyridoxamine 5'-phosphate oxidase family protein [Rhodospirillales bacterium]|nr:pyridoxamine 5'-phosphate oxidase family protein [Rhodospirillales bacterium]